MNRYAWSFPQILVGSSRPNFENKAAGKLLYSIWNGGDWFFFCVLSKEKEEKEAKAPTMNSKIHDEAAYDVASPFIIRISCFSYTPVRSLWKLEQTFYPAGILISSILYPQLLVNLNTTILLMTVTAIFNCDRSLIRNIQIARRGRVLVGVGDGG